MAVPAMAREQHIFALELSADADRHGFLPGGEVWKSGNLARGREPLYVPLEQAYPPQRTVHVLPVGERRCGHFMACRAAVNTRSVFTNASVAAVFRSHLRMYSFRTSTPIGPS